MNSNDIEQISCDCCLLAMTVGYYDFWPLDEKPALGARKVQKW